MPERLSIATRGSRLRVTMLSALLAREIFAAGDSDPGYAGLWKDHHQG
jgi:hypothetical protein